MTPELQRLDARERELLAGMVNVTCSHLFRFEQTVGKQLYELQRYIRYADLADHHREMLTDLVTALKRFYCFGDASNSKRDSFETAIREWRELRGARRKAAQVAYAQSEYIGPVEELAPDGRRWSAHHEDAREATWESYSQPAGGMGMPGKEDKE